MSKKIVVLFGSSRDGGNTEYLAEAALEPWHECTIERIYLKNYWIEPIIDKRHLSGFSKISDDYEAVCLKVMSADIIIFATPIYWYSMSTQTKTFIDRFTDTLRHPSLDLKACMKNKHLYVVCTGANPNEEITRPMLDTFKLIANYFDMTFMGSLWANTNKPKDILNQMEVLERAKELLSPSLN